MNIKRAAKKFNIFSIYNILVIIIIGLAIMTVLPLYWMITGSFKEMIVVMQVPPDFIPMHPVLSNYIKLFTTNYPVMKWMMNSLLISLSATFLSTILSAMMGYSFAKKKYPGKEILFIAVLATMMLPKQASLIPLFITMKNLNLVNSLVGAVIPLIAWPYGIFLMRQFIKTIPDSLIESANIDGASEVSIFTKIILPLIKPAIATLAIIMFMTSWGDFMWQMIILKKIDVWTLNLGVSVLVKSPVGGAMLIDYGLAMAGGVFAAIPVIIVFFSFQKYFTKGIVLGAVKE